LRASRLPILLLTPEAQSTRDVDCIARFQANVPQLRVQRMPGDVHDLVSYAAPEFASIVGSRLEKG